MKIRAVVGALVAAIAVGFMVASAYVFRPDNATLPPYDLPVQLMVVGAVLLGAAIFISRKREPVTMPRNVKLMPDRANTWLVIIGIVLLALEAEISGGLFKIDALLNVSTHIQYVIWCAGVGLVAYGMAGAPRLRLPRYDWRHVAALAAIVVLAFSLRAISLDTVIWQSIDEVHWMNGVRMIGWERDQFDLLRSPSGYQGVTAVYTYWTAGTVALFGTNWIGIRMTNAIIGTLTVIAMYGLGRALFDRRMALIAALVLATFPPFLHYGRISLAHMTDAFVGVALIMFVVRGLRWGKRADWALAGVTLGLSQYFFESGRLLFPVLALAWFTLLLIFTPKARTHVRGMVITLFIALVMALPVYYDVAARGGSASARLSHSSSISSDWLPLIQDGIQPEDFSTAAGWALSPFLFYVHAREFVDFWGGNTSLLHPLVVPFFLLGVFYCVWRWRSPLHIFPLFIIAVGLGNALLSNKWGSPRYITVMPILALMIAIGIRYGLALIIPGDVFGRLRTDVPRTARLALRYGLVGLIAAVVIFHPIYYFNEHVPVLNRRLVASRPYPDMFDAVIRASTFYDATTTQVWLISTNRADFNIARGLYGFFTVQPTYELETIAMVDVTNEWIAALPRDRSYVFMIEPGLNELVARLSVAFPSMFPPVDSDLGLALPPEKEFFAYYAPIAAQ